MSRDPLDRYVAFDRDFPVPEEAGALIQQRMFDAYDEALAGEDEGVADMTDVPRRRNAPEIVVTGDPESDGGPTRPARRWRAQPILAAAVVLLVVGVAWLSMRSGDEDSGEVATSTQTPTTALSRTIAPELDAYCTDIGARITALPWRFEETLGTFASVRAQLDELVDLVGLTMAQLPDAAGVADEQAAVAELRDRLARIADDLGSLQLSADNAQWNTIARDLPARLRDLESAFGELGELGIDSCTTVPRDAGE